MQRFLEFYQEESRLGIGRFYGRFNNICDRRRSGYQRFCEGAFEDDLSGKNYVIYTDNSVNETGNYNIFAASYDPEQEEEQILIHAIETEAEWQRIELMLQKLSNGPEGYGE